MADRQTVLDALAEHGSIRKAAVALNLPKSTVHDTVRRALADSGVDPTPQTAANPGEAVGNATTEDTQSAAPAAAQGDGGAQGETITRYPLTDPKWLAALHRYASLLLNGVHPDHALAAAQRVDDDFDLDDDEDEQVRQLMRGLNPEGAVQFAELKPPPGYVGQVYDAYAFGEADIAELADALYAMRADAYLQALNEQLSRVHQPGVEAITDQGVVHQLHAEARAAAEGIAETHNRDLASRLGRQWLESSVAERDREATGRVGEIGQGAFTRREREAELRDAADSWLSDRADWKSALWALDAVTGGWNSAVSDFAQNNPAPISGHVEPDSAVCDGCAELVGLGEIPYDETLTIDPTLHPNCEHGWVYTYDASTLGDTVWGAQGEPVPVEATSSEEQQKAG